MSSVGRTYAHIGSDMLARCFTTSNMCIERYVSPNNSAEVVYIFLLQVLCCYRVAVIDGKLFLIVILYAKLQASERLVIYHQLEVKHHNLVWQVSLTMRTFSDVASHFIFLKTSSHSRDLCLASERVQLTGQVRYQVRKTFLKPTSRDKF